MGDGVKPQGRIIFTCFLPGIAVPSQNDRDREHWARSRRRRQALEYRLRSEMRRLGVPELMVPQKRSMHIESVRTRLIEDVANLIGGAKDFPDAAVRVGLLHDDSDQFATITYSQRLCAVKGGSTGTFLTIREGNE